MEIAAIIIVAMVSFAMGLYLSSQLSDWIGKKKDKTEKFNTVTKRREYQKKNFKKNRPSHNNILDSMDDWKKDENGNPINKKKRSSGKRKYYKRKNNTNRNKKATRS
tara:strand:- start:6673 stop:6993 length:321 start_codon:yes stop_codon:yes gene_type:complete